MVTIILVTLVIRLVVAILRAILKGVLKEEIREIRKGIIKAVIREIDKEGTKVTLPGNKEVLHLMQRRILMVNHMHIILIYRMEQNNRNKKPPKKAVAKNINHINWNGAALRAIVKS
jgi:hypothetical protein